SLCEAQDPTELVADKGYHSRGGLKGLEDSAWKSRISEPKPKGINRWKGDDEARRAVYNNRNRLLSEVARQAFKLCAELVERAFALTLDRGGMRRTWLPSESRAHYSPTERTFQQRAVSRMRQEIEGCASSQSVLANFSARCRIRFP
ncbi:MAG: hypothetical protein ACRBM6_36335, partial [Geminicoccales bacterium]